MQKKKCMYTLFMLVFGLFTSLIVFPTVIVKGVEPLGAPPPNSNVIWDFDVGDIFGWEVETSSNGTMMGGDEVQIFNVSDTIFGYHSDFSADYYWVELSPLYWNATTRSLHEIPMAPPKNVSLINSSFTEMKEDDDTFAPENPNLFITKNGTSLMLDWSADALITGSYNTIIGPAPIITITPATNEILLESIYTSSYVHLDYDDKGVLEWGEIYRDYGSYGNYTIEWTRIYDFDPLNEVSWSVGFGDFLYYGHGEKETRFEIISIYNTTYFYMDMGKPRYMAYQVVLASISIWDFKLEQWNFTGNVTQIGVANDYHFQVWNDNFDMPLLVIPLYATGDDLVHEWMWMPYDNGSKYDSVTNGYLWVRLENSSTLEYEYYSYFSSGIHQGVLNYSESYNIDFPEPPIFYKNRTMLPASINQLIYFDGYTVENKFDIIIEISSSPAQEIYFAAFPANPFNLSLPNNVLFIDLMVSSASFVNIPINLTINYYSTLAGNYELFYYNMTSKTWINEIIYDDGSGTLTASLNHASIFGLTSIYSSPPTGDPPGPFALSSDAETPTDTDGAFTLSWTTAIGATNYTIYRCDVNFTIVGNSIITVGGTIVSVAEEISSLSLSITGMTNGTYFFIAIAYNPYGNSTSNIVVVVVGRPDELYVPFGDVYLIFTMISIVAIILYVKQKKIRNI